MDKMKCKLLMNKTVLKTRKERQKRVDWYGYV